MLSMVGTAVGGLIGWSAPPPPLDTTLRALLHDVGLRPGDTEEELAAAVRTFQARSGLPADGVAGPRTVHLLVRERGPLRFAA
jgi:peptidoglycan hydrolase-like protein with peptidoglycan-binding domain